MNLIGKKIGDSIITQHLADSGMCQVFLAEQEYTERQVVVKLLHHPEDIARFLFKGNESCCSI
jgi:hypothetical protein